MNEENTFEWRNINVSIKKKSRKSEGFRKKKAILINQSGAVKSGQLLAIQGPSGCGKTTLLNALTGKMVFNKKIKLRGEIEYNSKPINKIHFGKYASYIRQYESMFSYLTVRDNLTLAARFQLPVFTSAETISNKIHAIMTTLSINEISEIIVGSATEQGISGGEYKRVLIGKELLRNPSILFLDEPTSGLDAFQALNVMETMDNLTKKQHKIVIAVLHQPRSSIFSLFDMVLLLSGGMTMYFGPSKCILAYFEALGLYSPLNFNPADYYVDLVCTDNRTTQLYTESQSRISYLATEWAKHEASTGTKGSGDEEKTSTFSRGAESPRGECDVGRGDNGEGPTVDIDMNDRKEREGCLVSTARWFLDFGRLFWRANVQIYRNYGSWLAKFVTVMFFAVLLSLIYQSIGYSQKNIQDRIGLIYFIILNQSFGPLTTVLNIFPDEKRLVNRELENDSYFSSSYFCSRMLAETPSVLINAVVYTTIVYWSAGLNPLFVRYILFLVIVCLASVVSKSLGFLISAWSPSAAVAQSVGSPVLIVFILVGGFYINVDSLPDGAQWVPYVSFVYWAFSGAIINEFRGETFSCPPTPAACQATGEEVLMSLSFDTGSVATSIWVLVAISMGFQLLAYVGLLATRERYCKLLPDLPSLLADSLPTLEHLRDNLEEPAPTHTAPPLPVPLGPHPTIATQPLQFAAYEHWEDREHHNFHRSTHQSNHTAIKDHTGSAESKEEFVGVDLTLHGFEDIPL